MNSMSWNMHGYVMTMKSQAHKFNSILSVPFLSHKGRALAALEPLRLDWRLIFWIEEGGDEILCFSLLTVAQHDPPWLYDTASDSKSHQKAM